MLYMLQVANNNNKYYKILIIIFISLPIFSLVLQAFAWLRFGIDLPFLDDWRDYESGTLGSLNYDYLFQSTNDTLYPVGKILDSLAYRIIGGNGLVYQFISMVVVLGLLLFLQWKLLSLVTKNRLMVASAFSLTILMVQPDTYWGLQNLAYHQALPLIGILLSIYIVINNKMKSRFMVPILFVIGLFSGLSYTSGAFSILTLGAVFIFFSFFINKNESRSLLIGGMSLLISGFITATAQLWVIVMTQKGVHTGIMALPIESSFWLYILGKVGRSVMLPFYAPLLSFALTIFIVLIVFFLVIYSFKIIFSNKTLQVDNIKVAYIFIPLLSVILVYLCLVAAGRANLYPENYTFLQIFIYGFPRFHFYWVTLLWPWVAIYIFMILNQKFPILGNKLIIAAPLLIIPVFMFFGVFSHLSVYKNISGIRERGLECIRQEIYKNTDILCTELYPLPLKQAVLYGEKSGASFTRTLPKVAGSQNDN